MLIINNLFVENSQNIIAGVELEEEHPHLPLTLSNGVYCGKKMFDCPTNRALFIPFEQCQPDERFVDPKRSLQPGHSRTFEDLDSRLFGNVIYISLLFKFNSECFFKQKCIY